MKEICMFFDILKPKKDSSFDEENSFHPLILEATPVHETHFLD